jgi:hypothetical protein
MRAAQAISSSSLRRYVAFLPFTPVVARKSRKSVFSV